MSGSYVYEFPGMRNVSLSSADAFVIVFALDDYSTWEEASRLRDMVHEAKDCADTAGQQQQQAPIVVVGNKCEVEKHDGDIMKETPEATVVFDWENGYVESSAKERRNINKIFKELLVQARARYDFGGGRTQSADSKLAPKQSSAGSTAVAGGSPSAKKQSGEAMRRRQSLPAVPVGFLTSAAVPHLVSVGEEDENGSSGTSKRTSIRE